MRQHRITGGGGVMLNVTDQGPEDAPALLLIHGWSQAVGCWQAQAPLAEKFRVVAFDLRGHGDSDKPADEAAYQDTTLWGDDVKAVIDALGLNIPVLVGWSYGARVIASYIDSHGADAISGAVIAGGILAVG
jgi:non-heme chloroperoxidase